MIRCSMIHWLIGAVWLCSTNASQPRTDSRNRTKISPLAKSNSLVGVGSMPRQAAISLVSSGKARPEKSRSFFLPLAVMPVTGPALPHVAASLPPIPARRHRRVRGRWPATRSPPASVVPGTRCANGPTVAPGPTTADSQTEWITVAPAATVVSRSRHPGPILAPAAMWCRPPAGCRGRSRARLQRDADIDPGDSRDRRSSPRPASSSRAAARSAPGGPRPAEPGRSRPGPPRDPRTAVATGWPSPRRRPTASVRYSSPLALSVGTRLTASASRSPSKAYMPGVDLGDGPLLRGGVRLLHDAGERPVGIPDDPAVAGGIVQPGGQDGHRGAARLVLGHELPSVSPRSSGVSA